MKMVYDVKDRPRAGQTLVFAFQQILAIMAATIAVPMAVGNGLTPAAALFGAGVGTIIYLLFTKFRSPVFLGSSFAFIPSMLAAFAGATSMSMGWLGIIIGAGFAALVYVILAIIVKCVGVKWINKVMPAVVIGPVVAIIGLSLSSYAISLLTAGNVTETITEYSVVVTDGVAAIVESEGTTMLASPYVALVCGLVTLVVVMLCSVYGKKMARLIPFLIGILAGYALAAILTGIGMTCDINEIKITNFGIFGEYMMPEGQVTVETFLSVPNLLFGNALAAAGEMTGSYIATIAVAYIPVSFVVFAEHLADHKNLSLIIEKDLTEDPGLSRTLLGDGIGSAAGAFFGGCPNTTYGESIACVALTRNASVISILIAAIGCIVLSFITPAMAFLASIPDCVMGGVCLALYGFIAMSGLKMFQKVNLDENKNVFVASIILLCGIGGLQLVIGEVTITSIAFALILGILVNLMLSGRTKKMKEDLEEYRQERAEATAEGTWTEEKKQKTKDEIFKNINH